MRRFSLALVAGIAACCIATAQAPSLAEQVKAQYKPTRFAPDSTGLAVIQSGVVLSILKGGILGVPPANGVIAPASYKDGDLHPPGAGARMLIGPVTRYFQVGEKVYVAKIDVNLKGDRITLLIVECDSCNGVAQPSSYKSEVAFHFPKGSLATADFAHVQETIGAVFSIEGAAPAAPAPAAQPQRQGIAGRPAPPALGSVYVSSQNSADRLSLNQDGTFSLIEGGQNYTGTYSVSGATLKLHIVELQKDVDIAIQGAQLVVNGDETWVPPNQ